MVAFWENSTSISNISSSSFADQDVAAYHRIQTIATLTISALLIPLNGILVGALCRPSLIRQPMTWLFIHVAAFDIVFLISRLAWNYDKQSSHTGTPGCRNMDLFLRIMEKTSEDASGYMTSAIAVLRAVVVWRSRRARLTRLTNSIVLFLSFDICLVSLVGSTTMIMLTCGKLVGCADGVNPLYGPPQAAHSLAQVLFVNVPVFVCYTYVCIILIRSYRSLKSNIANRIPHLRTLKFLIPYTLIHTLLTAPSHLNMVFHPGCLQGSKADVLEVDVDNIINTIWLIAVTGLNPLLLYFCNESLRDGVAALVSPLRSCRSDRSHSDQERPDATAQT